MHSSPSLPPVLMKKLQIQQGLKEKQSQTFLFTPYDDVVILYIIPQLFFIFKFSEKMYHT